MVHLKKLKGPWRLTLDTNPDDCNLHCIMCEEHSPYSKQQANRIQRRLPRRRMAEQLIREAVAEAASMGCLRELIPSTMGEPLLFEHFGLILDLCAQYNVLLNLTTNSTFPKRSATHWAELIVPITSDVKISWNGAKQETFESVMRGQRFDHALRNLQDFIAIRDQVAAEGGNYCQITLQVTYMECNYRELPAIVKFAAKMGVNRIKGHHLWINSPEMKDQSLRRSEEVISRWNAIVQKTYQVAEDFRLPSEKKVILENIHPLAFSRKELLPSSVCPFLGREVWIATDGRFNPCCAPDELRRTLGDFGNLMNMALSTIWNSPEYNALCQNYHQIELCKSCNMRRPLEEVPYHELPAD